MKEWSVEPQPPWLAAIFWPAADGGLDLLCPVVMVHGNHEGFAHLAALFPRALPAESVAIDELPTVDSGGFIHYLPSGWRCLTTSRRVVGGVGGIESSQRRACYHHLAYIDDRAVMAMLASGPLDELVTHQGPAAFQGDHGSPTLDLILERGLASVLRRSH